MGIISLSRKKEFSPPQDSSDEGVSKRDGLQRVNSESSVHSTGSHRKLKSIFKGKTGKPNMEEKIDLTADKVSKVSLSNSLAAQKPLQHRPVSTIVENHDDDDGEFESDYESDQLNDGGPRSDTDGSEVDEIHIHRVRKKPAKELDHKSQISAFMGYCGMGHLNQASLTQAANEESKRTYSLLDQDLKIYPLSCTTKKEDPRLITSAIGDHQVAQIEHLTKKLGKILKYKGDPKKQEEILAPSRTLFDKYGTVSKVIGRGAYGLIKIIDSGATDMNQVKSFENKVYAVKELQRRPNSDLKESETKEKFAERILSEFVISSTLNNRHIVKTIDLMYTLPPSENTKKYWAEVGEYSKISQVMECTPGGNLFTYITTTSDSSNQRIRQVLMEENECFVKQISRGLWYMHQHGVAHCDLKLENILVAYEQPSEGSPHQANVLLKLSDFGKSNVVQTKWDKSEQLTPYSTGPIGTEPYIAPEEYRGGSKKSPGYSAKKKDCWALGVLIFVLFNILKELYSDESNEDTGIERKAHAYAWHSTEPKSVSNKGEIKYKDKDFDAYARKRMVADYDAKTKEWLVHKKGSFAAIESLFCPVQEELSDSSDEEEEQEFCELRKMLLYSLLDPEPSSRLTVEQFLHSDWMKSVDICV